MPKSGSSASLAAPAPSNEEKKKSSRSSKASSSAVSGPQQQVPATPAPSAILPPVRRSFEGCKPIERRDCPTPGCDSSGHLGGKQDRHFTQEACPLFHNMSRKACREMRSEINKRAGQRRKAQMNMAAKSPIASPTNDQKRHAQLVKEARGKFKSESSSEESKKVHS